MILEKDLNEDELVEKISLLMNNDEMRENMKKNAKAMGKPHACEDIYGEIKKLLERG